MLTWFPTPYPNELLYSVLCRYYVSSGMQEHSFVKQQLFGTRPNVRMLTLYPNDTVQILSKQLPAGVFNARDIILQNTLFMYYTRMYGQEKREELLEDLLHGRSRTPTHLWKTFTKSDYTPRYCPICVQEDTKIYGEAYYHVEHQIPISSVCVHHKCWLQQIDIDNLHYSLQSHFYPLSSINTVKEPDVNIVDTELMVSQLLYEYWKLPNAISPPSCNNLYQELLNKGYAQIYRKTGIVINKEKLHSDLCDYHGTSVIERVFGTHITTVMMNRIQMWEQLLPDRYIMIQAMLGMSTKTVFSSNPIQDTLKVTLERMAAKKVFRTRKQLADELHMVSSLSPKSVCSSTT